MTPSDNHKVLVLVAEDDKFYSNIFKNKLSMEGYEVMISKDGEETLNIAKEKKPQLIILDLIMPIKDGFEVLKSLKSDPELKNIKVLVLSDLGQDEDKKLAKQLGADDYYVKANITISEMVDKVKQNIQAMV